MAKKEFEWEIKEHVLDFNEKSDAGWVKQLNKVKWGNNSPVFDIRQWHYPDDSDVPDKMGKGVTLSRRELTVLAEFLKTYDIYGEDSPFSTK